MNIVVFALFALHIRQSLAQSSEFIGEQRWNSDEDATQSFRFSRHVSTTPKAQEDAQAGISTTEDIVHERVDCEHCLREHRECTSLLKCKVCHVPCQVFEDDAEPTVAHERSECERCLQNHPKCKNTQKCDPCKTQCGSLEKDVQASIRAASRCKICKEAPRCKKHGKCDSCKKYCQQEEQTALTTETPETTTLPEAKDRASHILNLSSSRRKPGVARLTHRKPAILHEVERDIHDEDVVAAAAPSLEEICNPMMVSPVIGEASGGNLPENAPRYYTIGGFRPGPKMNVLLHLLNIHRTEDIDSVIVVAKLKSTRVSAGKEVPVIVDFSKLFTNVQSGEGNRIDGPTIQLTSEVDKELEMATEKKKAAKGEASLTPEEVYKVIQHAIQLHKMREEGGAPASNVVAQTPPSPVRFEDESGIVAQASALEKGEDDGNIIAQTGDSVTKDLAQSVKTRKPEEEEEETPSPEARVGFIEEILPSPKEETRAAAASAEEAEDLKPTIESREPIESGSVPRVSQAQLPLEVLEEEAMTSSRNGAVESSSLVKEADALERLQAIATTVGSAEEGYTLTAKTSPAPSSVVVGDVNPSGMLDKQMETEVEELPVSSKAREMMEDLKKTIEDRRKALEEATIVGKQRVEGALEKIKELVHKEVSEESKEEAVVGMEQEPTTTQPDEAATIEVGEQDRQSLVEKFTDVIASDLAGSDNLTRAEKEEIEKEVSKLVKSTIDGATQPRANEMENLDRDLTNIERLVEAADVQQKAKPSKGAPVKKGNLKKVGMKKPFGPKHKKGEELVGEPFVINAEETNAVDATTAVPTKATDKPAEAVTHQPDVAKALMKSVTDIPEYVMNRVKGFLEAPKQAIIVGDERESVEQVSDESKEAQSKHEPALSEVQQKLQTEFDMNVFSTPSPVSSKDEGPSPSIDQIVGSEFMEESLPDKKPSNVVANRNGEHETDRKGKADIDWNLYTTSTSSPSAPWVFPTYEGTTLSITGRQSDSRPENESAASESEENKKPASSTAIGPVGREGKADIDWNLYTTSTSSPSAPWVFPTYEGTTLSITGRQSDDSDARLGERVDWTTKEEPRDSFEAFNTFGKLIPAKDTSKVVQHKFPSDLKMVKDAYFYGDMELPLRMKYYSDGTIKLAVDKKKYCQCSHCASQNALPLIAGENVIHSGEGDGWPRNNEASEFEDVALGMSAPVLTEKEAAPQDVMEPLLEESERTSSAGASSEEIKVPVLLNRNVGEETVTTNPAFSSDGMTMPNQKVEENSGTTGSASSREPRIKQTENKAVGNAETVPILKEENVQTFKVVPGEPVLKNEMFPGDEKPDMTTNAAAEATLTDTERAMRFDEARNWKLERRPDIEPLNENTDHKTNAQIKRESTYLKRLKERKNRRLVKQEKKKGVFKRSALLEKLLGSEEDACSGDCDNKARIERHLNENVQQRVQLATDLLSLMKDLAADKQN